MSRWVELRVCGKPVVAGLSHKASDQSAIVDVYRRKLGPAVDTDIFPVGPQWYEARFEGPDGMRFTAVVTGGDGTDGLLGNY